MASDGASCDIEHLPDDFSNPAFKGAYRKGALAARRGEPRSACPYPDYGQDSGRLTFSRAFRKEWARGYDREIEAADSEAETPRKASTETHTEGSR